MNGEQPLPKGQLTQYESLPVVDLGWGDGEADFRSDHWRLRVFGEVETPLDKTLPQIQEDFGKDAVTVTADLHCVSRWSTLRNCWEGLPVARLLEVCEPRANAKYALVRCLGGYSTVVELVELNKPQCLLAWKLGGRELPPAHGGPLRLVIPHLYAWKSAKWVVEIEFTAFEPSGYWEERGFHLTGDASRQQRLRGDDNHPDLSGTDVPQPLDPKMIVIASDWADEITTFLTNCARTLVSEILQNPQRGLHYTGPCSCRPNFVHRLLETNPNLPIFFFGHGDNPTTNANGKHRYYRLLGQPDQNGCEYVLFEQTEHWCLFQNRVICAIGCYSSEVIVPEYAEALGITLIGYPDEVIVNSSREWLNADNADLLQQYLLSGPRTLLENRPAREAVEQMNMGREELIRSLEEDANQASASLFESQSNLASFSDQFIKTVFWSNARSSPEAKVVGDGDRKPFSSGDG